jgi:hypothetical protein
MSLNNHSGFDRSIQEQPLALERLAENETGAHPLAATFILNTAF